MDLSIERLDRSLRYRRDNLLRKRRGRIGAEFVNAVLSASGRPSISDATFDTWMVQLASDQAMSESHERCRPLMLARFRADYHDYFRLPWADHVLLHPSAIYEVYYILIRALRPASVVETGVGIGRTSALILAALQHNEHGKLTSIELPNAGGMAGNLASDETGSRVPTEYRPRWRLVLDNALDALPGILRTEKPDVFSHDSDHSYKHMAFEYSLAASMMAKNSVIVSDDTRVTTAFFDVMHGINAETVVNARNPNLAAAVLSCP